MRIGDGGLIQGGVRSDTRKLFPPIAHEPTSTTGLRNVAGSIVMARLEPGSAQADFFILASDTPAYDAGAAYGDADGFAVFGHVVEGMDVVKQNPAAPTSPTEGEGVMKGQMLNRGSKSSKRSGSSKRISALGGNDCRRGPPAVTETPGQGEITMENDSIRASGGNTLVDVWIDGKLRGISVSRGAIEAFLELPPDRAAAMTEEQRCEFVRTHLSLVMSAAKIWLRETDPGAGAVSIDAGQLGGPARGEASDPRGGERRKAERRKSERPEVVRAVGERRRGDRRKTERRGPPGGRSKRLARIKCNEAGCSIRQRRSSNWRGSNRRRRCFGRSVS